MANIFYNLSSGKEDGLTDSGSIPLVGYKGDTLIFFLARLDLLKRMSLSISRGIVYG